MIITDKVDKIKSFKWMNRGGLEYCVIRRQIDEKDPKYSIQVTFDGVKQPLSGMVRADLEYLQCLIDEALKDE